VRERAQELNRTGQARQLADLPKRARDVVAVIMARLEALGRSEEVGAAFAEFAAQLRDDATNPLAARRGNALPVEFVDAMVLELQTGGWLR
jgi:hypothetical protein